MFITACLNEETEQFAAVHQVLDYHKLRIVRLNSQTPPQEHNFGSDTKITSLAWSIFSPQPGLKKRRKQQSNSDSQDNLEVLVLGTQLGELIIYSPAHNSVLETLKLDSDSPVSSITKTNVLGKLKGVQKNGQIFEFNLNTEQVRAVDTSPVDEPNAILQINDSMIICDTAPHLIKKSEIDISYMGFATPVTQVLSLDAKHFAAISSDDRQILIYNIDSPSPCNFLLCPNTNAQFISKSGNLDAIACVSEDGKVYVFDKVLDPQVEKSKKRRQPHNVPKLSLSLTVQGRPQEVCQTMFVDDFLSIVWFEQGSYPVFDKVQWRQNGQVVSTPEINLERAASAPVARENLTQGRDEASNVPYNEVKSHITSGENVEALSDDEETLAERLEAVEKTEDVINLDDASDSESDGDRMQDENVDSSTKEQVSSSQSARLRRQGLTQQLAQPGSFATLLNQALKLDDKQLLEICLEEKEPSMIKNSIMKLEPRLAAALLEHLASTMARSPNRSAKLMQWIRWTIVIHGTYLVTLPNLLKTLASLHSSLTAKASSLPKLLALQGRLELLEEQLEMRHEMSQQQQQVVNQKPEAVYDENAVIINGEEADIDMSE